MSDASKCIALPAVMIQVTGQQQKVYKKEGAIMTAYFAVCAHKFLNQGA